MQLDKPKIYKEILMKKNILASLLAFFCFVVLGGRASDSEEAEESKPLPRKVTYILLHDDQHELYQVKKMETVKSELKKKASAKTETTKKEWVTGSDKKHDFLPDQKASLTIKGLEHPRSIQFLFESTSFKSDAKRVNFTCESAYFLNKIGTLSPDGDSKQYNHLCLTLYAIYKDGDKRKVTESPLYAKWKEKETLSENGVLKKESKAKFYTLCDSSISGRLAYFTTGASRNHIKARKDSEVFPIQCSSCYNQTECSPICKEFKAGTAISCNDKSNCSHTEPNALFHVFKHKDKLFSPLIAKAGGVAQVKNIGFRFFSFYQSCNSCLQFLKENKKLSLAVKDFGSNINFLYYFQRIYQHNHHVVKLSGKSPLKRFTNLHNNGQLLIGSPEAENKIKAEWGQKLQTLGCINLPKEIDLNIENKILLVHPLPEEDISEGESLKIYVAKA